MTLLYEARKPPLRTKYLYHGTSLNNLVGIATSNILGAYSAEEHASMTRSVDVASGFAKQWASMNIDLKQGYQFEDFADDPAASYDRSYLAGRAEAAAGARGAILILDRVGLVSDFAVSDFFCDGSETEQEEVTTEDIEPLDRYLVGIVAPGFDAFVRTVEAEGSPNDVDEIRRAAAFVNRFRLDVVPENALLVDVPAAGAIVNVGAFRERRAVVQVVEVDAESERSLSG